MSLNQIILTNLQTELNMARAKRYNNVNAGLPIDVIDNRIEVLNAALEIHRGMMAEDERKESQK